MKLSACPDASALSPVSLGLAGSAMVPELHAAQQPSAQAQWGETSCCILVLIFGELKEVAPYEMPPPARWPK